MRKVAEKSGIQPTTDLPDRFALVAAHMASPAGQATCPAPAVNLFGPVLCHSDLVKPNRCEASSNQKTFLLIEAAADVSRRGTLYNAMTSDREEERKEQVPKSYIFFKGLLRCSLSIMPVPQSFERCILYLAEASAEQPHGQNAASSIDFGFTCMRGRGSICSLMGQGLPLSRFGTNTRQPRCRAEIVHVYEKTRLGTSL
jgi:hypothetical protein